VSRKKIADFCSDRPLTVQQIVYFSNLSRVIEYGIQNNPSKCDPKKPRIQKLTEFMQFMGEMFFSLNAAVRTTPQPLSIPLTPVLMNTPPILPLCLERMLHAPGSQLKRYPGVVK